MEHDFESEIMGIFSLVLGIYLLKIIYNGHVLRFAQGKKSMKII